LLERLGLSPPRRKAAARAKSQKAAAPPSAAAAPADSAAPGDALARGALEALGTEPRDEEELSALLEAAPGAIAAALARLEIEGLICRGRDGRWAPR